MVRVPDPARELDVQTLRNPHAYTPDQIRIAFTIAYQLNRGKLIVLEEPRGC